MPGTVRNCRSTTQSSSAFNSTLGKPLGALGSVYRKISPTGVASGERLACAPAGRLHPHGEMLRRLIADKFVVRPVLEDQRDLRQAELRHRPDGRPMRYAVHFVLDWNRHQALDFFRGVAGKKA